jgi:hypothetical protein
MWDGRLGTRVTADPSSPHYPKTLSAPREGKRCGISPRVPVK